MSMSAFGVEHGEIHKGPYPGGQWGPNATGKDKKRAKARTAGTLAAAGTGGALMGGVLGNNRNVKAGGALIAAGGVGHHLLGTKHDIKRGVIANPYKRKNS